MKSFELLALRAAVILTLTPFLHAAEDEFYRRRKVAPFHHTPGRHDADHRAHHPPRSRQALSQHLGTGRASEESGCPHI